MASRPRRVATWWCAGLEPSGGGGEEWSPSATAPTGLDACTGASLGRAAAWSRPPVCRDLAHILLRVPQRQDLPEMEAGRCAQSPPAVDAPGRASAHARVGCRGVA